MSFRYMRTILFFDLPSVTSDEKKKYRKFVKEIKKIGFYMIQESVYVKLSINSKAAENTKMKVNSLLPDNGNVILLTITEKQFNSMDILMGEIKTDIITSVDRVVIL